MQCTTCFQLDFFQLTKDGPVDDVGVGEPNLDRVFFVVDGIYDPRHRFVREGNVAVITDQRLEGERARQVALPLRLVPGRVVGVFALQVDVAPLDDESRSFGGGRWA